MPPYKIAITAPAGIPYLTTIFANALKNLNIKFAWIVNSEDGLDEISPYAKTNVIQLKKGQLSEISIDPNELNVNGTILFS